MTMVLMQLILCKYCQVMICYQKVLKKIPTSILKLSLQCSRSLLQAEIRSGQILTEKAILKTWIILE